MVKMMAALLSGMVKECQDSTPAWLVTGVAG